MARYPASCFLIALVLFFSTTAIVPASEYFPPADVSVRVCFSPDGECMNLILKEIAQAEKEILIMAYAFGSLPMAKTLVGAHQKGVKVELLLDKSERQEGYTPAALLSGSGIPVWFNGVHAVMNSRVVIIDERTVITGSHNFNTASESMNAENLLIVQSGDLARKYRENWIKHRQHSENF